MRISYYVRRFLGKFIWPFLYSKSGILVGAGCIFMGKPLISKVSGSVIKLGSDVLLISNSSDTALGIKQRCLIRTLSPAASITIGSSTGCSGAIICSYSSVEIGSSCLIGSNVTIFDTDFHIINSSNRVVDDSLVPDYSPVKLGDNVFVGASSIIMKGVNLGNNCVVGAGSVVTKSFPENSIIAGNPAVRVGAVELDK